MQDAFKNLSAQQLARLIQYAEGGQSEAVPDGNQLHAEKNAPWVNGAYSSMRFPTYQFVPYPKVLYNADWIRCNDEYLGARSRRVKSTDDDMWRQMVADALQARNDCARTVENADEERALGTLWCETPTLAVEVKEQWDRKIAQAAAESNYDDRNLGTLARAERDAADAASDTHLVEVARTPIRKTKEASV